MSLGNSSAHRPDEPKRRQPPPPGEQDGAYGARQDVAFFFRGAFRSKARDAITRAITTFEQARADSDERSPQWLILSVDSTGTPFVAATRLADGRTFRAATVQQIVADLRVASDSSGQ